MSDTQTQENAIDLCDGILASEGLLTYRYIRAELSEEKTRSAAYQMHAEQMEKERDEARRLLDEAKDETRAHPNSRVILKHVYARFGIVGGEDSISDALRKIDAAPCRRSLGYDMTCLPRIDALRAILATDTTGRLSVLAREQGLLVTKEEKQNG